MSARVLFPLTVLVLAGSAYAVDPPAVLRIHAEQIRSSVAQGDFEQVRAEYANALRGTGNAPASIALSSLAGAPELWRMEFHMSFAAMEGAINSLAQASALRPVDARAAELLDSRHTFVAVYREGLSLQVQQAMAVLPRARYLLIRRVEIQTGHEHDFAQSVRAFLAASDRAGGDQPVLAYQIFAGGLRTTYLFMQPLRTLATLDNMTPEGVRTGSTDIVVGDERLLYRVVPAVSVPPQSFVDTDHDFWAPGL
jgi:hypothetical protein